LPFASAAWPLVDAAGAAEEAALVAAALCRCGFLQQEQTTAVKASSGTLTNMVGELVVVHKLLEHPNLTLDAVMCSECRHHKAAMCLLMSYKQTILCAALQLACMCLVASLQRTSCAPS
jgi:hypothetical protein